MLKAYFENGTAWLDELVLNCNEGDDLLEAIDNYFDTFGDLPMATYDYEEIEDDLESYTPVNGGEFYVGPLSHVRQLEPTDDEAIAWALAYEMGEPVESFEENGLCLTVTLEGSEYNVYTEDLADEAVEEYVQETLWAFNSDFLADETGIDEVVFSTLSTLCETANDAIRSIVEATCGIEQLVESAIRYDGRGNFLSPYDGEEIEIEIETGEYKSNPDYLLAYRQ